MRELITNLYLNRSLIEHHISFEGSFITSQVFEEQDIMALTDYQLHGLGAQLILDYNDQADHGTKDCEEFWNQFLEPINIAFDPAIAGDDRPHGI